MYNILKYPLSTEKSVKLITNYNEIVFIVDNSATKKEIKNEFENMFKVKVLKINTLINNGKKKAYIKLSPKHSAVDIATQLGLM